MNVPTESSRAAIAPWLPSFAAAIVLELIAVLGVLTTAPMRASVQLKDFGSLLASGRAATAHLNPYSDQPLVFHVSWNGLGGAAVNLNPPISVLAFQMAAPLDPVTAFRWWYVLSLLLYAALIALLIRAYPSFATPTRVVWLVAFGGLWATLDDDQIYVPIGLSIVAAWLALEQRRDVLAGLLMGLVIAVKPNFAIWIILVALAGFYAPAAWSLVSGAVVSALPLLVYGPTIYRQWADVAFYSTWRGWPGNMSLAGLSDRAGVPYVGMIASVLLFFCLLVWVQRTRPPVLTVTAFALVASLLISPIAWPGYAIGLIPILFARRWTAWYRLSAILFVFPPSLVWPLSIISPAWLLIAGSITACAVIALLVGLTVEAFSRHAPAEALSEVPAV